MLTRLHKLPRDARDTLFLLLVIGTVLAPQLGHLPLWCSMLALGAERPSLAPSPTRPQQRSISRASEVAEAVMQDLPLIPLVEGGQDGRLDWVRSGSMTWQQGRMLLAFCQNVETASLKLSLICKL